jgi:hypothetical protein
MPELFDTRSVEFYTMLPEELWAARQLRRRELRELRQARTALLVRFYGSIGLVSAGAIGLGVWAPFAGLAPLPVLARMVMVGAWGTFLHRLILQSRLNAFWQNTKRDAASTRDRMRMHNRSIRDLDVLLRGLEEKSEEREAPNGAGGERPPASVATPFDAACAPQPLLPAFHITHGDDLDLYLVTDAPGAEAWRVEVQEVHQGRCAAEPEKGWISRHQPLRHDQCAWLIGVRCVRWVPTSQEVYISERESGALLYRLLLDAEGQCLYAGDGQLIADQTRPFVFGCAYCTAGADDWVERRRWLRPLFVARHHEFALSACPECEQPFLEEAIEFADWVQHRGDAATWLRWRPLSRQARRSIEERCVAGGEHHATRLPLLRGAMMSGRRLLRDPHGRYRWIRGAMDDCDRRPPR